jgi:hypothetical protein
LSHDAGGNDETRKITDQDPDDRSIRCPKCGEVNMAADVRCWACDAELHPAPKAPAPAEPAPQPTPAAWLTAAFGQLWSLRNVLLPPLAGILLLAAGAHLSRATYFAATRDTNPELFLAATVGRLALAALSTFFGMRFIFAAFRRLQSVVGLESQRRRRP